MIKLDRLFLWGLLGACMSIIQLVFAPWMLHFLVRVSLIHVFLMSAGFIVLGLIVENLPDYYEAYGLCFVIGLVSAYFSFWLFTRSTFVRMGFYLRYFGPIVVIVCGLFLLGILYEKLKRLTGVWWYLIPILLLLVISGKSILVLSLPTRSLISERPPKSALKHTLQEGTFSLADQIYPFSVLVSEGIDRYGWLLPVPEDDNSIIFLLMDAFRYDYLGKKFSNQSITPNIDQLASKGLSFPQYRVQASWTKPSTASLFTGLYPRQHGTIYGGGDRQKYQGHVLQKKFETLAERLKKNGYDSFGTAMSGHLGSRYFFGQGFDVWLSPGEGYAGDFFTQDQALFWLMRNNTRKKFIYLHIKGPHQPFKLGYLNGRFWQRTPYLEKGRLKVDSRYDFRTTKIVEPLKNGEIDLQPNEVKFLRHLYASQLNFYDRKYVSPLIERLKTLGTYRSSLVTITGDHGEELYDHGSYAHGQTLYEESVHTPLIMKFPEDMSYQRPQSPLYLESIDLSATLAEFGEVGYESMSGTSFLHILKNGSAPRKHGFDEAYAEQAQQEILREAMVVKYPWKLIHDYKNGSVELYNLEKDTGERSPVPNRNGIKESLKGRIFTTLGSDSLPETSVSLREASEAERENLEGLGYIE